MLNKKFFFILTQTVFCFLVLPFLSMHKLSAVFCFVVSLSLHKPSATFSIHAQTVCYFDVLSAYPCTNCLLFFCFLSPHKLYFVFLFSILTQTACCFVFVVFCILTQTMCCCFYFGLSLHKLCVVVLSKLWFCSVFVTLMTCSVVLFSVL